MKFLSALLLCTLVSAKSFAQYDKTVQNRPYTDLRPFHFGVVLGTHLQDMELLNVGPQTITLEDGTQYESVITTDQDQWDPGFTVGVLGEIRLSTHFQLRIAPMLYFGTRHVTFRNFTPQNVESEVVEERQSMKTAYVTTAFDLIFASPRWGNHRPYLMAGITPALNLSAGGSSNFIKMKHNDVYAEVGFGLDNYLQFFKLRPELKFMFSLGNSLDSKKVGAITNPNLIPYARSVSKVQSKMICLTFYFE